MSIQVVSIGNELLSGFTINSNAAVIGQKLLQHGFSLNSVTILPDDILILKEGLKKAMDSSKLIITTGGLGPTGDDLTRDMLAEVFGVKLVFNKKIAEDLTCRYGTGFSTLKNQSMVPEGAMILPNPLGTAPGFILTNAKSTVIALPGVPDEMTVLLEQVILYLENHCVKNNYVKTLYFFHVSERIMDPFLRILETKYSELKIGICPSFGITSVFVHSANPSLLDSITDIIIKKFKPYFFSAENKSIEYAIHKWMILHKKTFVCAESCTGGKIASRLTAISGSSKYFLGSIVSYSNSLKKNILGIQNIESLGAVSESVVKEMAKRALQLSGADFSLGVSGIAGPNGGSNEKPIGTIWGAIASKEHIFSGHFQAIGVPNRNVVIDYTATFLLGTLWRYLKHNHLPFS